MAFLCFTAYYIDNWRGVVITNSVHLFIIAVLLGYNIPESPRFLLKVKKHEEAKEVQRNETFNAIQCLTLKYLLKVIVFI